jgi:putative transposase
MTQGKIERYHRSMKNIVNVQNYFLRGELEAEIANFVMYYVSQRNYESLDKLTMADMNSGRGKEVLSRRATIKKRTLQRRRLRNIQAAAV